MATYEITIQGKGTFQVDSPSELTEAQAYKAALQQADADAMSNPTSGMSTYDKVAAGAGKAVVDLGRGAGQLLRQGIEAMTPTKLSDLIVGKKRSFADTLGLPTQADIDEARSLDAPLMRTTAGKVGNFAGNVAAAVPTMFIPGANTYMGATMVGAGMGALQPTSGNESRLMNTALGGAAGVAGQFVGNKAANAVATRLANRTNTLQADQASNAVRDATLREAQAAGYSLPPTNVRSGVVNSVLEGVSGKVKTAQAASIKNQEVTNALAKKSLGIAEDAPLDKAALETVRQEAGQAYEVVANLQSVNWDKSFERAVGDLVPSSKGAVKNPAHAAIEELAQGLTQKTSWTGRELVDDIRLLRELGNGNLSSARAQGGDVAKHMLGKSQMKAASLLEDLAERNLANNKAPASAIQDLKDARQLIAKSYSVERALDEATGNVSAPALAGQLKKKKPLGGELETIAKTGAMFPQAMRPAQSIGSANPVSAVDAISGSMMGGLLAAATGNPLGLLAAAGPLARPLVRSGILSGPYQRAMVQPPSYQPGMLLRGADAALWNPLVRKTYGPAASAGLLGYAPQQ